MSEINTKKQITKTNKIVRKTTKKLKLKKTPSVSGKTSMKPSFRLLSFNTYDEEVVREDDSDEKTEWTPPEKDFTIQMFGINEKGETAAIFVKKFTPFFYAKVGDNWTKTTCAEFIAQLRNEMGKLYETSILSYKLLNRKKLLIFK